MSPLDVGDFFFLFLPSLFSLFLSLINLEFPFLSLLLAAVNYYCLLEYREEPKDMNTIHKTARFSSHCFLSWMFSVIIVLSLIFLSLGNPNRLVGVLLVDLIRNPKGLLALLCFCALLIYEISAQKLG